MSEGETTEIEKPGIMVERITKLDEETLQQILEVEQVSFPEKMQSDKEELREILENQDGIHLLVRDEGGRVCGYIAGLRQSQEYDDLKKHDPAFEKGEKNLYVDSIAVKPDDRSMERFNTLFGTLIEEATDNSFEKITMHARTSTGFNRLVKMLGGKSIRMVKNWYGFGEDFDYLEMDLPKQEK